MADDISKLVDPFEGLVSGGPDDSPLCPDIQGSCGSVRPRTTLPLPVSVGHGNGVWPLSSTTLEWA